MNWLSMMSDEDKRQIVKELAIRLSSEPILFSAFEKSVEKVLAKYNFPKPAWRNSLNTNDEPLINLLNAVARIRDLSIRDIHFPALVSELTQAADVVIKLYSIKL